jgi:hypothetical protein
MCINIINPIHSPTIPSFCPPTFCWLPPQNSSHFILLPLIFKGLDSVYEQEHETFVFLSLAYFTLHHDL